MELVGKDGKKVYFSTVFLCCPAGQGKSRLLVRFGGTNCGNWLKWIPPWIIHRRSNTVFEQDTGFLASQNETLVQENVGTKHLYQPEVIRYTGYWVSEMAWSYCSWYALLLWAQVSFAICKYDSCWSCTSRSSCCSSIFLSCNSVNWGNVCQRPNKLLLPACGSLQVMPASTQPLLEISKGKEVMQYNFWAGFPELVYF